jgi:hypothetical protein
LNVHWLLQPQEHACTVHLCLLTARARCLMQKQRGIQDSDGEEDPAGVRADAGEGDGGGPAEGEGEAEEDEDEDGDSVDSSGAMYGLAAACTAVLRKSAAKAVGSHRAGKFACYVLGHSCWGRRGFRQQAYTAVQGVAPCCSRFPAHAAPAELQVAGAASMPGLRRDGLARLLDKLASWRQYVMAC